MDIKVKDLIEALQNCNPEASVTIGIKQYNRSIERRIKLQVTDLKYINDMAIGVVRDTYSGCYIDVALPFGAYISRWPNKD